MNDLEDSFAKLLGRQPTDTDRQNLYRVRDALELKNNDALWLVIMALQSYDERYKAIPAQIEKAAGAAAAGAASRAQSQVNEAVAALVPSVERAVEKAAAGAVSRIQLGTSFFSLWAGTLMLAFFMGLGWVLGSGIFAAAAAKQITWSQFFEQTGWGIGIGAAIPGLLALSLLGDETKGWQWGTLAAAIGGILILGAKWWTGF
jgi:hypothetical protein